MSHAIIPCRPHLVPCFFVTSYIVLQAPKNPLWNFLIDPADNEPHQFNTVSPCLTMLWFTIKARVLINSWISPQPPFPTKKFGVGGNPTSIRMTMPSQHVGSDPAQSCDDHQRIATQLFRLNAWPNDIILQLGKQKYDIHRYDWYLYYTNNILLENNIFMYTCHTYIYISPLVSLGASTLRLNWLHPWNSGVFFASSRRRRCSPPAKLGHWLPWSSC